MASFGESVEHIIVNGSGPCLPHMEAMYRINVILNHICPKLFPPLYPKGFNGTIQQVITGFNRSASDHSLIFVFFFEKLRV